jgi:hypothetical protein
MSDPPFVSLTPANALARLAFSDVYDALTSRCQNNHNQTDGIQAALGRMRVESEQTCDDEIVRLRREMGRTKDDTDGEASETLTEPDTDTEQELRKLLGMVWIGQYLLALEPVPANPERGWAAGKGPMENMPFDLLLCTRSFAKSHGLDIRNPHARFNFFLNSHGLFVMGCSRSPSTQLAVNGDAVQLRPYHLNQHSMKIQIDRLEYHLQWTDYAADKEFMNKRRGYIASSLGGPLANIDFEMPTPLPIRRTMGRWTLGRALGAGGHGRVFFASDPSGSMAAIKVMERTSRNCHAVDEEIQILQEVTDFAQRSDDGDRVMHVAEVIYSNGETFSSGTAFDNVGIVLKPMTPHTFGDLVGLGRGSRGMTMEAAAAFRGALLGVKVMHDARWLHRDLKPTNIGLIGSIGLVGKPPRSVLLDVGTSRHIQTGGSLRPVPGTVGTVGYLAPELELEDYDHSIDIWSMGIILFELTYNCHPWKYAINPWRHGMENEALRPSFGTRYQNALDRMANDYRNARASPAEGYIHRECHMPTASGS